MLHLTAAALIWAFSFGLIKNRLAGVDPSFVAVARLLIALLVFLPFLRSGALPRASRLRLVAVGAIQYGAMYVAYVTAFRYLEAFEVVLFTVVTPIYVTLIHDLFERRLHLASLFTALLAVLGAGIVSYGGLGRGELLTGAALVQLSNLCFALGQVAYKRWLPAELPVRDHQVMALLYLGGFGAAGLAAAVLTDFRALSIGRPELLVLLYLGAVASGLGFFLWNAGARLVEVGTLAILNDLKIPLGVAVSLLVFGERVPVGKLVLGSLLIAAALVLQNLLSRPARGA